ncbi:bifunctional (p)ppGpp synthetase/guanosine-3',5'-bis(diphosphate) 3'-pyrophosphohydrolase [Acinetobacter qingfengensis]|uniref:RelA/SpoT family protein n=1 Tax=Acinetobacter qingfengensis TaxID=1262585 RepID=A0A1E7QXJ8_9GAMM|nr:HD domain-containing protein [Acinetobacter qingfengensis]KAA8731698.1 bifunctional (p)ppGpp synthetase/guanosine-3',5'-bis(diphosphate) 3'-pyrophosphohydrolase [Acinetobacter qingfengensis]OEY91797.1 RelA/SpoT family protein [Acinetobacter qingfengensis]
MPGDAVSHAKQQLKTMIEPYLSTQQVDKVMDASNFADDAHKGVTRKSGEPYIIHPIAVACMLARMRMDKDTLIAALLHDVIEDTPVSKEDVSARFNPTVADLVDGVTKLTSSSDKQFNKAASFRKFLQATLQDPRVIIIKLSDRYHNMTTLGALRPDKRKRIAQETFDIYVPMARLVGMNEMADWLENLCYQNLDLDMYASVQQALQETKPRRCEYQATWEKHLNTLLKDHQLEGRIKKKNNNTELLRHFIKNDINLHQLTHSHAFDIILRSVQDCDTLVDLLRQNFTTLSYTDHIRKPMPGGNQALLLHLKGEKTYLSLTIQTELMRKASRFGLVLGEAAPQACRSAIQASLYNLNDIIDDECAKTTFSDLLDYLHQEKIVAYTPQGHLHELPRGATAVDFAYAASLFLGNHAVGCKINGEQQPLSTAVQNGQTVLIITDVLATPNPDWLSFVNTQKARRAIQNILKDQDQDEQILIGKQALNRALKPFGGSVQQLNDEDWEHILSWRHLADKNALFEQIAVGDLVPQLVANKLYNHQETENAESDTLIQGTEGVEVKYGHCCNPVFGDTITGHLTRRGLIVHRTPCQNLIQEQRLHPENIMPLSWQNQEQEAVRFHAYLVIDQTLNDEQTTQAIYQARKSNAGVESVQHEDQKTYFNIVVIDRNHIAQIIRDLRMILNFPRITRLHMPIATHHTAKVS